MSWLVLLGMSLSLFFLLVLIFRKFLGYMKKEQNLVIEPFKDALIDKDNPVGLSPESLAHHQRQETGTTARPIRDLSWPTNLPRFTLFCCAE